MLSRFVFEAPSGDPGSVSASSGINVVEGQQALSPAGATSLGRSVFVDPSTVPSSSWTPHSSDPSANSPPSHPVPKFLPDDDFPTYTSNPPKQSSDLFKEQPPSTRSFEHHSTIFDVLRQSNESSPKEESLMPEPLLPLSGDEDKGDVGPALSEEDAIKAKRLHNTVVAPRSRKQELEHQRSLQDAIEAEGKEKEMWRARAQVLEALLRDEGYEVPRMNEA
jgi:hypothetical protein